MGFLYYAIHHLNQPDFFLHRGEGIFLLHPVDQKPWCISVTVSIANNFIYKCQILGNIVRRAEGRWARRCDPLLQRLLPATLAGTYRNPWGTRSSMAHWAQASCSFPITTLGARRARSVTPASPCPPARWYQRWRLCPGAGVGSICTACSRGRTSPSSRAGGGRWDEDGRLCHGFGDSKQGVPLQSSWKVSAGTYERVCRCLRKAF